MMRKLYCHLADLAFRIVLMCFVTDSAGYEKKLFYDVDD
jgi:hypothetical protein